MLLTAFFKIGSLFHQELKAWLQNKNGILFYWRQRGHHVSAAHPRHLDGGGKGVSCALQPPMIGSGYRFQGMVASAFRGPNLHGVLETKTLGFHHH